VFRKVLIANRGEVAARIARAARESGATAVGVCSEADRHSSWAQAMDELVCLGPAAAKDSYLDPERVVQAALQTGATAVHPGWGFLAENARFAALVEQHGLTFVGPSPALMSRMGLKTPAKDTMRAAGLDVIPGSVGPVPDAAAAQVAADAAGYPVILKADAGGGGRGMRKVDEPSGVAEAFASARAEAEASFSSSAVYVEKFLTGGRHVEVQLVGDAFGNAIHLFERDCSVQRKHQKLIEESPCPLLSQEEREQLGQRAADAAAAIGYAGAGTIEFLRDAATGAIYFMEMNTRLQVEHPVSELITGIDIAKLQFEVAANRPLSVKQSDVRIDGHSIELRINAEDPTQDFRPSPGVLTAFEFPDDVGPGKLRIDTHLVAGDEVPPHYDSLIAKVLAHGATRDEAIETLLRCLAGAKVEGVSTTIPFHQAVLQSEAFRSGDYDTQTLPGWPVQGA
jgi:acetyl-CoA carboxylase biotin carboxylase subunit